VQRDAGGDAPSLRAVASFRKCFLCIDRRNAKGRVGGNEQ
jgi:hypothetical protein